MDDGCGGYDLVISGGMVVDGTGEGAYCKSIAVHQGSIAGIGEEGSFQGKRSIDARELVVAPGFIDIHNHSDWRILENPAAENYIHQGVTTLIGGNCGFLGGQERGEGGILDMASFLGAVGERGTAPNFGVLAGYGTIRQAFIKENTVAPKIEELERIGDHLEKAMEEGAFGLSVGLEYLPGRFVKTNELIAVGRIIRGFQGFLAIHMRDEQARILHSVAEAIKIGKKSRVPVQISHIKACGPKAWGLGQTISAMMAMAVAMGVDVSADVYPYLSSSTGLSQLFPSWAHERGGLTEGAFSPSIKRYALQQLKQRVGEDLSRIQFVSSRERPHLVGKNLQEILLSVGKSAGLEEGRDFLMAAYLLDDPSIIYHYLSSDDVAAFVLNPHVMVSSDGEICDRGKGQPHPRSYGCFPRFLHLYTCEEPLLSLEEGIMKMTGLPARRLGLKDRGRIQRGCRADLVLLHPEKIKDRADFLSPHQYPEGIEYVLINGEVVLERGDFTGAMPGQILYGPGRGS